MKTVRQLISGNKLSLHLIFSASVLAGLGVGWYLMQLQGYRFENNWSTGIDCIFFLLCMYTGRWLLGRWYLRKELVRFIGYTLLSSLGLLVLKWLVVRYVFSHPHAELWELGVDIMPFFLIGLIMGMFLKLIRATVQKEVQEAQIKAEQKQSEFNVLQAQLSPHFLFNVLNNLYGISIDEHERVPALLLKLSNLLRYSVYSAKKPFVPLKEELDYIQNYIDFEQIRISDRLVLQTDIEPVIAPTSKIAPLVLIVFVENAFKHAKNTLVPQIHITISLKISDNFICFTVSNSYQSENQNDQFLNEESGVGLANTLRRLELLYGSDYSLRQEAANDVYTVELRIKIKQERHDQLPDRR
ncbi:GHKL domain-containing protein [Spirosoma sp. HMF4905]|uniref:GHKL domain-containing protein n=1 Tax=Spirosoma arboris TaxID=2682092 RepID=A0A7K1SIX7_9BACT|nr:histidine kinase [Spirosoma arboris]MVM33684.1 GHKL domain-containing protein [Spirosoma arboris]